MSSRRLPRTLVAGPVNYNDVIRCWCQDDGSAACDSSLGVNNSTRQELQRGVRSGAEHEIRALPAAVGFEHLGNLLAKSIRGNGPGWGLSVQCHRGGWGVVFGNLAGGGGGGGGGLPSCVTKAIGSGPIRRAEDAIHAATRALRQCCA